MTSAINRGGLVDGLSYLIFGNGESETYEPFCEAMLIAPYPHESIGDARAEAASAFRILAAAEKVEDSRKAIWEIDQTVRVKGWSEETVNANLSIWSKRKVVSVTAYIGSVIATLGSAGYGVLFSAAGQSMQQALLSGLPGAFGNAATHAAVGMVSPFGIGLSAAFIAGVLIWNTSSSCWSESELNIAASPRAVCHDVADARSQMLQGNLYKAVEHRGKYGQVSASGVMAPKECEWLWIEALKKEENAFENPLMRTGGDLVMSFAKRNPFDVMDQALLKGDETNHQLLRYVEGAKGTYASLGTQVRSVKQIYDLRRKDIQRQAEHNRILIRQRKQAALNVVDSIYWSKVDSARAERDQKLRPFMPDISGLSLDESKAKQRAYESNSTVIRIKDACRGKIASYDSYRDLAHAGIGGWFNPQLRRENEKESMDLSANHTASLSHLSLFYPNIRALYSWTRGAVDAFEAVERSRPTTPPSYAEVMAQTKAAPSFVEVVSPQMPAMQTLTEPESPNSSVLRSWANEGSGLGLDLFLTCAQLGTDFYTTYMRDQGRYERIIEEHTPQQAPPVIPSAPPREDLGLPSYEEATHFDRPPAVPSAPPMETAQSQF